MSEFHGCLFMYMGSTLSGSSKITAHVQGATANSTASLKTYNIVPISSSTAFGAAASRNYKMLAVDVLNPPYRYNRMRIQGATGVVAEDNFLTIAHTPRIANSTAFNNSTTLGPSTVMQTVSTY